MIEEAEQKLLTVEPIIAYPKTAVLGKTYKMTVDFNNKGEWPEPDKEEITIYLVVKAHLFRCTPIDAPVVLVHRFGGSYGSAGFLARATAAGEGIINVLLINGYGLPVGEHKLPATVTEPERSHDV